MKNPADGREFTRLSGEIRGLNILNVFDGFDESRPGTMIAFGALQCEPKQNGLE